MSTVLDGTVNVTPGLNPPRMLIPVSTESVSSVHVTPESTSCVSTPVSAASASVVRTSVSKSAPESDSSLSDTISKYLVQYVPPPPAKKNSSTRVIGSRVLTSDEGYAILHEKEEKREKRRKKRRKSKKGKIRKGKRMNYLGKRLKKK